MPDNQALPLLSEDAFKELKIIVRKEYGASFSDSEIRDMGIRLLTLSRFLYSGSGGNKYQQPSDEDLKPLRYLHQAICHSGISPSVRDIASALKLRSSRSGFKILKRLMDQGFVFRNEKGKLKLSKCFTDCNKEPRLKVR